MEYCPKGTLFSAMQEKRLGKNRMFLLFTKVCQAVAHLHSKEQLVPTLNPNSIWLTSNLEPKIAEFDWPSVLISQQNLDALNPDLVYKAPEQLKIALHSKETDMWSLGVLLFEMFQGCTPFSSNSARSLIKLITEGKLSFDTKIHSEVKSVIEGLLAVNPHQRLDITALLETNLIGKVLSLNDDKKALYFLSKQLSDESDCFHPQNKEVLVSHFKKQTLENLKIDSEPLLSMKRSQSSRIEVFKRMNKVLKSTKRKNQQKLNKSKVKNEDFSKDGVLNQQRSFECKRSVVNLIQSQVNLSKLENPRLSNVKLSWTALKSRLTSFGNFGKIKNNRKEKNKIAKVTTVESGSFKQQERLHSRAINPRKSSLDKTHNHSASLVQIENVGKETTNSFSKEIVIREKKKNPNKALAVPYLKHSTNVETDFGILDRKKIILERNSNEGASKVSKSVFKSNLKQRKDDRKVSELNLKGSTNETHPQKNDKFSISDRLFGIFGTSKVSKDLRKSKPRKTLNKSNQNHLIYDQFLLKKDHIVDCASDLAPKNDKSNLNETNFKLSIAENEKIDKKKESVFANVGQRLVNFPKSNQPRLKKGFVSVYNFRKEEQSFGVVKDKHENVSHQKKSNESKIKGKKTQTEIRNFDY